MITILFMEHPLGACMRWPLIHGAVSFRDGTYRTDVAAAGKVYRPYRGHPQPAAPERPGSPWAKSKSFWICA